MRSDPRGRRSPIRRKIRDYALLGCEPARSNHMRLTKTKEDTIRFSELDLSPALQGGRHFTGPAGPYRNETLGKRDARPYGCP